MELERYTAGRQAEWDDFVTHARNASFLFYRDYMEYHRDRFTDHSLVFRADDRILALLPANEKDSGLFSHGGLTYGGMIVGDRMTTSVMLDAFEALRMYMADHRFATLLYKAIPHIYHRAPAEEDLYALFRNDARLVRRDVSSTISLAARLPVAKGRKSSLNVAARNGVQVRESDDFAAFMRLEEAQLLARHGVRPVHSAAELETLARRFPENIRLFTAIHEDELVAGMIVYAGSVVAHAQYIAASERGRDICALDAVIAHVIEQFADRRYFDFGISTEENGLKLNAGLIANKESYGARATTCDFYELDAAH